MMMMSTARALCTISSHLFSVRLGNGYQFVCFSTTNSPQIRTEGNTNGKGRKQNDLERICVRARFFTEPSAALGIKKVEESCIRLEQLTSHADATSIGDAANAKVLLSV